MRPAPSMLILIVASFLLNQAIAEDKITILEIYDQFVMTGAAKKCITSDESSTNKYLENSLLVFGQAATELQKQFPNRSKEEIAKAMKDRFDLLTRKVQAVIDEKGCADPRITDLINRFGMQSKWTPLK